MNLIIGLSEVILGIIIYTLIMMLYKGITLADIKNLKFLIK